MTEAPDPGSPQAVPGTSGPTAADPEPVITPLLEVIACDGADATPIVMAAQAFGDEPEVRLVRSPEVWFDQFGRAAHGDAPDPPDVTVFIGSGERMAGQRWIARAVSTAPDTRILAVIMDATVEHATSMVNQGARGLIVLPASPDRIAHQLREVIEPATRLQPSRRAAARHRRAMTNLTTAEVDVLDGMLAGLANKQIATKLSIGLRTVELRRSKIMRKMNAKSLPQLISFIFAARHGVG